MSPSSRGDGVWRLDPRLSRDRRSEWVEGYRSLGYAVGKSFLFLRLLHKLVVLTSTHSLAGEGMGGDCTVRKGTGVGSGHCCTRTESTTVGTGIRDGLRGDEGTRFGRTGVGGTLEAGREWHVGPLVAVEGHRSQTGSTRRVNTPPPGVRGQGGLLGP